jgi:hypothetical protein
MATKKKSPSKAKKSKKKAAAQAKSTKKPAKKVPAKKKPAKKIKAVTKSSKKPAKKKAAAVSKASKTIAIRKPATAQRKATSRKSLGRAASWGDERGADFAGQSGDLQGLSNRERADSESVDELIEEGNSFEAGVISGVEEAGDREGREVHTREVPEDDVPGEYLDEE